MTEKLCAKCGTAYDAAYDACPACAKRRSNRNSCLAPVIFLVLIGCCFIAYMELLYG